MAKIHKIRYSYAYELRIRNIKNGERMAYLKRLKATYGLKDYLKLKNGWQKKIYDSEVKELKLRFSKTI